MRGVGSTRPGRTARMVGGLLGCVGLMLGLMLGLMPGCASVPQRGEVQAPAPPDPGVGIAPVVSATPSDTAVGVSPLAPAAPGILATRLAVDSVPVAWTPPVNLYTCQLHFEQRLQQMGYEQTPGHYDATDTVTDEDDWVPLPAAVVAIGQACLASVSVATLPPVQLPTALALAIGANADTLVARIVARQLTLAGPGVDARAAVLAQVITRLLTNAWGHSAQAYLTTAHVALARQYIEQLRALGPAVLDKQVAADLLLTEVDPVQQTADAKLAAANAMLDRLTRVPLDSVPESKQRGVQIQLALAEVTRLWYTYVKTTDHADLTKFVALKMQLYGGDPHLMNTIVGTPAARITGDWCYTVPGLPASRTTPVRLDSASAVRLPTPGAVSILYIFQPGSYNANRRLGRFARLRKLHADYPTMQFVSIAVTQGHIGDRDFLQHPEQEAQFIRDYFVDSLHLPGTLCVTQGQFRTVIAGHTIPVQLPLLEAYHIDPRDGRDQTLLIDDAGWVVRENELNPELIQHLIAHQQAANH